MMSPGLISGAFNYGTKKLIDMENFTQIKVELDVQAQKLISQYMIDNERILAAQ